MKALFALLLSTPLLPATAQQPEVIFFDGEERSLFACPLEQYQGWRKPPGFTPNSTASYRGYVGTWRIEENRLYLTDIQADLCSSKWPAVAAPPHLRNFFRGSSKPVE